MIQAPMAPIVIRQLWLALLLAPVLLWAQSQPGSISGRIVTARGEPAARVRVRVVEAPQSGATAPNPALIVAQTETDATGRYRVDRVPSGRYLVTAGFLDSPTYYPGVFAEDAATIVGVTAGQPLTGIDLRLPPSVSGRVAPVASLPVSLVSISNRARIQTISASDGAFRFDFVPPGRYALIAHNETLARRVIVTVNDSDIANVELALLEQAIVTGMLALDGVGPIPQAALTFIPQSGLCPWRAVSENDFYDTDQDCSTTVRVRNGAFAQKLGKGEYRVSVDGLPSGYVVKSIVSGKADLEIHPLQLKSSAAPSIVATLGFASSPPGVAVSGRVRHAPSVLIVRPEKVSLLAAPGSPSPLENFTELTDAYIRPDGSFEFPMVPPGDYLATLSSLPVPAVPLTVTNNDLKNVEIVIPPMHEIVGDIRVEESRQENVFFTHAVRSAPHLALELSNSAFGSVFTTVMARCDGTFSVVLPEGSFTLTVVSSGHSVVSATYGEMDVLREPLKIASRASERLRIGLVPGGAPLIPSAWVTVCGGEYLHLLTPLRPTAPAPWPLSAPPPSLPMLVPELAAPLPALAPPAPPLP